MVAQLRVAGFEVTVDPENYPYGRFARTHDSEDNPIERWQPQEDRRFAALNSWLIAASPCGVSQMCAITLYPTRNGGILRVG
jgi:hypothetical protein